MYPETFAAQFLNKWLIGLCDYFQDSLHFTLINLWMPGSWFRWYFCKFLFSSRMSHFSRIVGIQWDMKSRLSWVVCVIVLKTNVIAFVNFGIFVLVIYTFNAVIAFQNYGALDDFDALFFGLQRTACLRCHPIQCGALIWAQGSHVLKRELTRF